MRTQKREMEEVPYGMFSMGDIDEVSALLGELKSGQSNTANAVKDVQATVSVISDSVKEMVKSSILTGSSLEAAHKYIEEIKAEIKEDIRPFMEATEAEKNQAKGWSSAINWVQGMIGGGIALFGGYIAKILGLI